MVIFTSPVFYFLYLSFVDNIFLWRKKEKKKLNKKINSLVKLLLFWMLASIILVGSICIYLFSSVYMWVLRCLFNWAQSIYITVPCCYHLTFYDEDFLPHHEIFFRKVNVMVHRSPRLACAIVLTVLHQLYTDIVLVFFLIVKSCSENSWTELFEPISTSFGKAFKSKIIGSRCGFP